MAKDENKKIEAPKKSVDKSAALMGAGIAIVAMLLIGSVAFAATNLTRRNNPPQQMGMNGQFGGGQEGMRGEMRGQRPTFGTVKTIDGSTLTVTAQDDTTVTVTVNDDTKYSQDGAEAKLGDIKTGDTIVIFGSVSDSKVTATRVAINPDFTPPQQ